MSSVTTTVKVGQVYEDKDKREQRRRLVVTRVEGLYAHLIGCSPSGVPHGGGRYTRIALINLEKRFTLRPDEGEANG